MNAREFLQTDIVLVGILLYALLGKLADVFAKGFERYWLRWHPGWHPLSRWSPIREEDDANTRRAVRIFVARCAASPAWGSRPVQATAPRLLTFYKLQRLSA